MVGLETGGNDGVLPEDVNTALQGHVSDEYRVKHNNILIYIAISKMKKKKSQKGKEQNVNCKLLEMERFLSENRFIRSFDSFI